MGNAEVHSVSPNQDEEQRELKLSRKVTYRQYCNHVEGRPLDSCLMEIPWNLLESVSLYERVNASFNAIIDIPTELPLRLPHLNYIDFSHNLIEEIPDSFGLLFHLKTLILRFNQIKSLPDTFFNLIKLEKIDLSHNQLRCLPNQFTKVPCLKRLNITHNKLKQLPASIGGVRTLKVILASNNRLQDPPKSVCDGGSDEILAYLRKSFQLSSTSSEHLTALHHNVFPRVRGNHLHSSVPNPHSAQVQYIQSQTHTTNTASRIKTPLLTPPDGSALDADTLRDRVTGLLYGAAIGDAIGIATCCMSSEECLFHYDTEGNISYSDIVQDELRVRWRQGDWTSNFDTMVLILDSLINWGGVIDELDFAKRLHTWCQNGFPDLGDKSGVILSETVKQVIEMTDFLKYPHLAAKQAVEGMSIHVYGIENGVLRSDDDRSSISSEHSSIIESLNSSWPARFPSSHPCIPARQFGTDNGALVASAILGVPYFHRPDEVEANTIRICRTTHSHPYCIASCVLITNLVSNMLQGRQDLDCYKAVDDLIHKASAAASKHLSDPDQEEEFKRYLNFTDIRSVEMREQHNMSYILKSLSAGLLALRSQQSFKSFIMSLMLEGGDSNSHCCLAGALLGCKVGYSRLPQDWVQGLRKKQTTWLNGKINCLLDMLGLP